MSSRVFKCDLSKNEIEFAIIGDTAYMYFKNVDYENLKLFFLLFRNSIQEVKSDGIKKIRQYVQHTDWLECLKDKTSWSIVEFNRYNSVCTLECDIENVIVNVGAGFGL